MVGSVRYQLAKSFLIGIARLNHSAYAGNSASRRAKPMFSPSDDQSWDRAELFGRVWCFLGGHCRVAGDTTAIQSRTVISGRRLTIYLKDVSLRYVQPQCHVVHDSGGALRSTRPLRL